MTYFGRVGTLAVVGLAISAASSRADETKIDLDKVPAAVLKAFKTKFPGATIKAAIKEEEAGKTTYEIESTQNGLGIDAVLTPTGEIVEVEKEIKTADLPAAVTAALKAKYPTGTLEKAEVLTKGDTTAYEVIVNSDGKKTEVVVDEKGKIKE